MAQLSGSASFAALLPLFSAPVNTRLYTPGSFGQLAMVMAITSLLVIPYVAGFSRVILLAKSATDADNNFRSLVSTLTLPCFLLTVLAPMSAIFGKEILLLSVFSVISFALASFLSLGTSWLIFNSRFKELSSIRISQAFSAAFFSITLGFLGMGGLGILFGHILGQFFGVVLLWRFVPSFNFRLRSAFQTIASTVNSNKLFFVTSLPAEILNTVTRVMPAFMFSIFLGPTFLGHFNMASRLLDLPASLISSAFSQYFQGLAINRNTAGKPLLPLVLSYSFVVFVVGAPFFVLGTSYAPNLADWVLGDDWRVSGEIAQYLSIYVFLRMVVSPVTFVIFLNKAFIVSLIMDIVLAVAVFIGLFVSLYFFENSWLAVLCFSVIYSLSYLVSFGLVCYFANKPAIRK
uniref:oligosaccharide flippase family protein n=1 Tax=Pararhizobium sp. IMCC3301 TaxID=3067904 RepID=UPI002740B8A2|nr:oligosaccharide flippase family protein [Pararhizobium sp. IMCC3301]